LNAEYKAAKSCFTQAGTHDNTFWNFLQPLCQSILSAKVLGALAWFEVHG
jgi:hypothetical protein